MGRVLGIDLGERRVGLAISDDAGRIAVPHRVLNREKEPQVIESVVEIAKQEEVDSIAVGYPLSMDGSVGPQARRVQGFARHLAHASGLPVELVDERLTSVQAERPAGVRLGRRRGSPADDLAAAHILQSYLDRERLRAEG